MYKAFMALFSGGLIGKGLGVVRELLLASYLGTGPVIAAYRVAQTSILVPINFFTADVLTAVVPLCKRYGQESLAAYRSFVAVLQWSFLLLALMLAVVVYCYAEPLVVCLAPGLSAEVTAQASDFARVLALSIPPYVVGGLYSYFEMGNGGYSLASTRASIQSLGLIIGTFFAVYCSSPAYLAWGFTVAYYLYVIWGAILLQRQGLLSGLAIPSWSSLQRVSTDVWKILRPLIFLPFILQGNVVVERAVASMLGGEVVAALDYARFVTDTGLILLAVPLGLAGLSTLSGLDESEFESQLMHVLPVLLMIGVPLSAFLWMHSDLIVHLLYERGAFNAQSSRQTQIIVQGLAIGFWAQVAGYVLTKALNAQLRNGDVLRLTAISVAVNLVVNTLLFHLLGPIVLGLSVSISALVLFILASVELRLLRAARATMIWLGIGTLGYVFIAAWTAMPGWYGLGINIGLGAVYWLLCFRLVPVLHTNITLLVNHRLWRLA